MNSTGHPPPPPAVPTEPTPPQPNGCLTAVMILIGVILLLPGLCALIFGGMMLTEGHPDSTITSLVMLGLVVGFAGVMLIRSAIKGRRR